MWLWMNIIIDTGLIGSECRPSNVPGMVFQKKNRPFGHGQMPGSFPEHALFIHVTFMATLSIGISASIHRISEHAMDGRVGWARPSGSRCSWSLASERKDPQNGTKARPFGLNPVR